MLSLEMSAHLCEAAKNLVTACTTRFVAAEELGWLAGPGLGVGDELNGMLLDAMRAQVCAGGIDSGEGVGGTCLFGAGVDEVGGELLPPFGFSPSAAYSY